MLLVGSVISILKVSLIGYRLLFSIFVYLLVCKTDCSTRVELNKVHNQAVGNKTVSCKSNSKTCALSDNIISQHLLNISNMSTSSNIFSIESDASNGINIGIESASNNSIAANPEGTGIENSVADVIESSELSTNGAVSNNSILNNSLGNSNGSVLSQLPDNYDLLKQVYVPETTDADSSDENETDQLIKQLSDRSRDSALGPEDQALLKKVRYELQRSRYEAQRNDERLSYLNEMVLLVVLIRDKPGAYKQKSNEFMDKQLNVVQQLSQRKDIQHCLLRVIVPRSAVQGVFYDLVQLLGSVLVDKVAISDQLTVLRESSDIRKTENDKFESFMVNIRSFYFCLKAYKYKIDKNKSCERFDQYKNIAKAEFGNVSISKFADVAVDDKLAHEFNTIAMALKVQDKLKGNVYQDLISYLEQTTVRCYDIKHNGSTFLLTAVLLVKGKNGIMNYFQKALFPESDYECLILESLDHIKIVSDRLRSKKVFKIPFPSLSSLFAEYKSMYDSEHIVTNNNSNNEQQS